MSVRFVERAAACRWVVSLMLLSACAPIRPLVDRDGKVAWHRVSSEHFVFESNIQDPDALGQLVTEFEVFMSAFRSIPILGKRPPDTKILVVAFDSTREYKWFYSDDRGGALIAQTPLGQMVLMPYRGRPVDSMVLKHELSHVLVNRFMPNAPDWLHEGLACTMETAIFEKDQHMVLLGDYSEELLRRALFVHRAELEILTNVWPPNLRLELYGASWLLVRYLIDHHLEAFLQFEIAISQGTPWRQAWDESIPVAFDEVYSMLPGFLVKAKFKLWRTSVEQPASDSFQFSTPSIADIHALHAALYLVGHPDERPLEERKALATESVTAALALEPSNPRALKVLSFLRMEKPARVQSSPVTGRRHPRLETVTLTGR